MIVITVSYFMCKIVFLLCFTLSRSANILGVFPYNLKSHFIIYDSLMMKLVERGHRVTVISPFPKREPPPGLQDIDVRECDRTPLNIYDMDEVYSCTNFQDPFYNLREIFEMAELDRTTLECSPVKQLLSTNVSFDAVIAEIFSSNTMMALAEKFNVTSKIWFSPVSVLPWAADMVSNPFNPSYMTFPYTSVVLSRRGSTFCQRFYNTMLYLYAKYLYYIIGYRRERMKQEHFPFVKPSLNDIEKTTSLVLTFSHFSLNEPVPLLPNVIEVGGLQIKEAKKLPQDIENFINDSERGVIYFSFGSLLKMETMPEAKLQAFLKTFSLLKQRVLWKWDNENLSKKISGSMFFTSKWMPQRDILAHPKVKLFISHGGALGINEAVYEGVPVLGIPFYGDQMLNLKILERHGAAEILEYPKIEDKMVMKKLEMMLNTSNYSENMKKLSNIFRDRPMSAMDTAVFWTEYVIRHKGGTGLRSPAADLPLYQYLMLDIIAAFIILIFFVTFLCIHLFGYFKKFILCSSSKSTEDNAKKSN